MNRAEKRSQRDYNLGFKLADEKLKNTVLNTIINIADSQYCTQIRKKFSPKRSDATNKNKA